MTSLGVAYPCREFCGYAHALLGRQLGSDIPEEGLVQLAFLGLCAGWPLEAAVDEVLQIGAKLARVSVLRRRVRHKGLRGLDRRELLHLCGEALPGWLVRGPLCGLLTISLTTHFSTLYCLPFHRRHTTPMS